MVPEICVPRFRTAQSEGCLCGNSRHIHSLATRCQCLFQLYTSETPQASPLLPGGCEVDKAQRSIKCPSLDDTPGLQLEQGCILALSLCSWHGPKTAVNQGGDVQCSAAEKQECH